MTVLGGIIGTTGTSLARFTQPSESCADVYVVHSRVATYSDHLITVAHETELGTDKARLDCGRRPVSIFPDIWLQTATGQTM